MLLAGDIGGTNTRLALYDDDGKRAVREDALPSGSFGSLEAAVTAFLGAPATKAAARAPRIKAAVFGIAGPVVGGRVKTTNLPIPWVIDERALSRRLGVPLVRLVNDLVAIAFGASAATSRKLARLQGPPPSKGATLAVLAAGTGLGEAALVWDGARFVPCGTEGGHSDFAPRSDIEWELCEYLARLFGGSRQRLRLSA